MLRIQRPGNSTIVNGEDQVLPDFFPHLMVTKLSSLIMFPLNRLYARAKYALDWKDADVTNRSC